ncbi:unnamed protein product [Urochloa decumbens]|uniref:aspartate--tRNA ligase n=1 Tax=Urochloa decumbens TaxID=240449 RepID=A0ABC8ZCQ9_9POAL
MEHQTASKKHTRSRGRSKKAADPYASAYGIVPFKLFRGREWTPARDLGEAMAGEHVLLFGSVRSVRPLGSARAVVVLFHPLTSSTVRCVVAAGSCEGVTTRAVRFAATLSRETAIDVEGVVTLPESVKVLGTTQQVEVQVRKIHSIGYDRRTKPRDGKLQTSCASIAPRPVKLEESVVEPEEEVGSTGQAGQVLAHIDPETSLNYDCINLPSLVDHATLRIQSEVEFKIMEFLRMKCFVGIHTQSMLVGSNISGRPVFRLEKSNCKMHRCKFIDFGAEMEIMDHYFEVCNIINDLFIELFKHLNGSCKKELETINQQYPFEPLKYQERILMLQYDEGIQMLKEVGTKVKSMAGLSSEHEKRLGRLIREKYDTDLFILHRHPLAVRPLYIMPCVENPSYSNSFDVFIRGEQVISGSQRIHEYELLVKRAAEFGFDMNHMVDYLGLLRYGLPPHGGFSACLYRLVMLFFGLDRI